MNIYLVSGKDCIKDFLSPFHIPVLEIGYFQLELFLIHILNWKWILLHDIRLLRGGVHTDDHVHTRQCAYPLRHGTIKKIYFHNFSYKYYQWYQPYRKNYLRIIPSHISKRELSNISLKFSVHKHILNVYRLSDRKVVIFIRMQIKPFIW